jgi:gliding motility-associated-like protein
VRKFLLFVVLQILVLHLFATDFTVTSNADSGPGTLRQALLDAEANGSATQDRIIFNIADQSTTGLTITIRTSLPGLTSNLVIDASTQPGTKFGMSDTKIIISVNNNGSAINGLSGQNCTDIEVYGLYFTNFAAFGAGRAIYIANASNITIGKAGKGNLFGMVDQGIMLSGCDNVIVSANIFGIDPVTLLPLFTSYSSNLSVSGSNSLLIGGDNYADGNVFVFEQYSNHSTIQDIINCVYKNNTLGYKTNHGGLTNYIQFLTIKNLDIINNIYNYGSITYIEKISGLLQAKGNQTNLLPNRQPDLESTSATPFWLTDVNKAIIGGPNPQDANVLNNWTFHQSDYSAIYAYKCYDILIQRNSISCITEPDYASISSEVEIPVITVNAVTANSISGKATPGAEVEVFTDSDCQLCNSTKYIGSAIANASGLWSYALNTIATGFIASASLNGRTSLFAKVGFDDSQVVLKNPTCNNIDGSIKGITVINSTKVEWKNQAGAVVGNIIDIDNLPAGTYTFKAYLGDRCVTKTGTYTLVSTQPKLNTQAVHVVNNSCGSASGAVTGITFSNTANFTVKTIAWYNQLNVQVGNALDLKNVPAGNYTLKVTNNDDCVTGYGPVNIVNTAGLVIDQTHAGITPTPCNQPTGSIKGISATGTGILKYSWKNAQGIEVGTALDLTDMPGGKYTLQVTDDSNCGPVYTTAIEIVEVNGVTMDETAAVVSPARCISNGSVKGIVIVNATSVKWFTEGGLLVSTQIDLTNAAPGNYYLVATRASCVKHSKIYTILEIANNKTYRMSKTVSAYAACGTDNGFIEITMDPAYDLPVSYRWVNTKGITIGTTPSIYNLSIDTYTLWGADESGCEKTIINTDIGLSSPFDVITAATVTNANCGATGSIRGVRGVSGRPPYNYVWTDAAGTPIGNSANLDNVPPGMYTVKVTDQTTCGEKTVQYTIGSDNIIFSEPVVRDLQLCTPGEGVLTVTNADANYSYRLYDSQSSTTPLAEEKSGMFKINANDTRTYYISQYLGGCESSRTQVKVSVGSLSGVNMPNAFSPNGDGINDTWKIPGIENYPAASVQIFSRSGQKVFESTGYVAPFDGNYNGKQLPAGTYFYIINLNASCNLYSGSVTVIR